MVAHNMCTPTVPELSPPAPAQFLKPDISTVRERVSALKTVALVDWSRRELPESVQFGVGTLLVAECTAIELSESIRVRCGTPPHSFFQRTVFFSAYSSCVVGQSPDGIAPAVETLVLLAERREGVLVLVLARRLGKKEGSTITSSGIFFSWRRKRLRYIMTVDFFKLCCVVVEQWEEMLQYIQFITGRDYCFERGERVFRGTT